MPNPKSPNTNLKNCTQFQLSTKKTDCSEVISHEFICIKMLVITGTVKNTTLLLHPIISKIIIDRIQVIWNIFYRKLYGV